MKKIAILGTRGIPASYSGFETSVQETSKQFVKYGYDVTVFCRANHYKERPNILNGVKLIYVNSFRSKHLDTVSSTVSSIFKLLQNKYDIIILYGVGNAYFAPIIKFFCKNLISVLDGADWKRQKWNDFAKSVLRIGRYFAVYFSNYYIVDNELLKKEYERIFKKHPIYIPYGSIIPKTYDRGVLNEFNIEEGKYIIFVGRFVKEKGIDFLIKNFEKTGINLKLVIVGGNDMDKAYEAKIRSTKDSRILFTGLLFGGKYESLLKFSLSYVSCSFLEGTSPSLLSAMAINGYALVSDLPENIETLKNTCMTFNTGNDKDFIEKLNYLYSNCNLIESERIKTLQTVKEYYSWEKISEKYISLF